MATREAVERRRANRAAARISKKLRASVAVEGSELGPALSAAGIAHAAEVQKDRHQLAWERFRKRYGENPRFAARAADMIAWEAWVAMVDIRDPLRRAWFYTAEDYKRRALCAEGREARASARRFKLAKLTMRQRYDAVLKGRKYDLF